MQKVSIEVSKDDLKKALFQLAPEEIKNLLEELKERKEAWEMMRLSESSLSFWHDPEEDIYSDEV